MGTAKSFPDDKRYTKGNVFLKKIMRVMLILGLMLCLSACSAAASDTTAEIYDMDEKQANYYSDYKMSECSQQIAGNTISGTYRGFNGMVALWLYEDAGGFPVDVKHRMRVSAGKVKLILYYTDGKTRTVETIGEFGNNYVSDEWETATIILKKGLSCVKLVGTDDAEVTFEIEIKPGSFIGAEP